MSARSRHPAGHESVWVPIGGRRAMNANAAAHRSPDRRPSTFDGRLCGDSASRVLPEKAAAFRATTAIGTRTTWSRRLDGRPRNRARHPGRPAGGGPSRRPGPTCSGPRAPVGILADVDVQLGARLVHTSDRALLRRGPRPGRSERCMAGETSSPSLTQASLSVSVRSRVPLVVWRFRVANDDAPARPELAASCPSSRQYESVRRRCRRGVYEPASTKSVLGGQGRRTHLDVVAIDPG